MILVACAIIEHQNKVLVTQRGYHKAEAGLWEFPGGKLEEDESPQECIIREIAEELELQIAPYALLQPADHQYPDKHIRLIPLVCRLTAGSLQLKEHAASQWLAPAALRPLNWCPADVPVLEQYLQWLQKQSS
ncbi:(deoxy)nucleoside triphosphate pyrophosphohydrolase [Cesiribacter sp. SM1]|uniref:(deoxy)nucleoside triphosphate pyrophosphohydrolase n=1 Tax=Cesiribacter sp. SM1 TaxID=2861196 RepID=UPI001CD661DA|nr:(deoxy)nucleoside triphosphate pyrophosphohydrolase [Cesiribacter sp. SM1]